MEKRFFHVDQICRTLTVVSTLFLLSDEWKCFAVYHSQLIEVMAHIEPSIAVTSTNLDHCLSFFLSSVLRWISYNQQHVIDVLSSWLFPFLFLQSSISSFSMAHVGLKELQSCYVIRCVVYMLFFGNHWWKKMKSQFLFFICFSSNNAMPSRWYNLLFIWT